MTWADAFPNFLIGLREGLEAGLVVSILLAALRKTAVPGSARVSSAPVWLGVLGAVSVAGSFAAVLTFSTNVLSSSAQEAVGGVLSVLAVALVTAMVFWMRRTAATLSAQLRGEVARAAAIGAGALAVTAFLAVGREGLETTLFLWTAIKASGSTLAPLLGAGLGLAAAVAICWLMYRQAVRINLGVFFGRTALALIVIAAGVLSYGLGDLQDAGLLSGSRWIAVDLTGHVDPNSWWMSIVTGLTDLSPRMTVLQVVAWAGYLVVVLPVFVLGGRTVGARSTPSTSAGPAAPAERTAEPARWARAAGRRPRTVAAALVLVPAAVAGAVVLALPSAAASATTAVSITARTCAPGWTSAHGGDQRFTVTNRSGKAGEIDLDDASGAVVAEIETIGPATTADLDASLGRGSYQFRCLLSGQATTSSATVQVSGRQTTTAAVAPVTVAELTAPNDAYRRYAARELDTLSAQVTAIRHDLARGDLAAARTGWLAAQLSWERVGASYDSFGDAGTAVDGLPDGLQGGVHDPDFTGLQRLEYGLFHGQSAASLIPVVDTLGRDVAAVRTHLSSPDLAGDPTNLPIRAHEILEDALRDHLSGLDSLGGGAQYAQTWADSQVTVTVLGELASLITARSPHLVATARTQLDTLQTALLATRVDGRWQATTSTVRKQAVDAAVGAVLETLSAVPDLLEVPVTH